jgi:hypothetical protein
MGIAQRNEHLNGTMKLTELEPQWVQNEPSHSGQGVMFLCPIHKNHHVQIWFTNPLDKKSAFPIRKFIPEDYRWTRVGSSFETLSLENAFQFLDCDWKGTLTEGELVVEKLAETEHKAFVNSLVSAL